MDSGHPFVSELELLMKVSFLFLSKLLFEGWISRTHEMGEFNTSCMKLADFQELGSETARCTAVWPTAVRPCGSVLPSAAPNSRGLRWTRFA